ncbi:juvenile hormone esterase-like [Sabethes cyaneus]|uniref:juvenile hormone esterase-like n=1 Tax=Sabethes cyaneus TaxID=53552 RepID=UPI00237DA36A|nr:juvenile hormone esterase-like [Sabethes cyaneus]
MYAAAVPLFLAIFARFVQAGDGPVISTPSGVVQGTEESCGLFCTYYSFKGIPYAQPPVGQLRFRNPVPHPGWDGVRDGSLHGSVCPQAGLLPGEVIGDEDCLFLNVYSKSLIGLRPVMFWIHGGAFSIGSGNDDQFNAQKIVLEDVLLVTINYRLGTLGFLSTGDQYAQGNWGLKDCIEALRWVQRNIVAFGGDPNKVTITGNSAGAVLVHFIYMSGMADGLFHQAIAQSGTGLTPFAFQTNPKFYADRLAANLQLSTDSATYIEELRNLPANSLVPFQYVVATIPVPRYLRPLDFVPSAEPENSPEERALTDKPMNLMRSRDSRVPLMMGYNDIEGSFFTTVELLVDPTVWSQFNSNPGLLVPQFWNIATGTTTSTSVINAFQQYYFHGQSIGPLVEFEWAQYYGDHMFLFPIDYAARFYADHQTSVYYYQFSYDGDLNLIKQMLQITHPGAIHTDELPYLFEMATQLGITISPTSHALTVSNRMVRMWTNFLKYGNPTPEEDLLLQNIIWPTISAGSSNPTILDIGYNLIVGDVSSLGRLSMWHNLQTSYANNPFL